MPRTRVGGDEEAVSSKAMEGRGSHEVLSLIIHQWFNSTIQTVTASRTLPYLHFSHISLLDGKEDISYDSVLKDL